MAADVFVPAIWRSAEVILAAARTTDICRAAQAAHGLQGTAAVALGRLLTSAALLRFITPRQGSMSLQVLADGGLRQLFADVNEHGHLRGYCKGAGSPVAAGVRASVSADVGSGMLSVMRAQTQEEFTRSATQLTQSEIDTDAEIYAHKSEQVPTVLTCDVLLDAQGHIAHAGGVIAQALPKSAPESLQLLRAGLAMPQWLVGSPEPGAWLLSWQKEAEFQTARPLKWQCRCSRERAVAAVQMLPADELSSMIAQAETAQVDCEFCGTHYSIEPAALGVMEGS